MEVLGRKRRRRHGIIVVIDDMLMVGRSRRLAVVVDLDGIVF